MPPTKPTTMAEAVSLIEPGDSIALGLALEHAIPFAAGHELLRQDIGDLTAIGPISDMLVDQLIGGDRITRVRAAWVGNVSTGTGHRFREAVEAGAIEVEDHSNFSIALALQAAAMGVPYLPTRSLLGSDIFASNDHFKATDNPYGEGRLALVPAIRPDWAILHVQRADPHGNAHFWGNTGIMAPALGAADNVLVTAENLVDPSVIRSDPSRVITTHDQVTAVVECPYGAYPSPLAGRYPRDHDAFMAYAQRSETQAGYDEWARAWIHDVPNRDEYMDRVTANLALTTETIAPEVRYGY